MAAADGASGAALGAEYDDAIMRQQDDIKSEIAANQPLVSEVQPIELLDSIYASNAVFLHKVAGLKAKYPAFRAVRGDGNCFYRAYLCSLLQHFARVQDGAAIKELYDRVDGSKARLVALGMPDYCIEDFHEMLLDEVKFVRDTSPTPEAVAAHFNDNDVSMYCVMYARFLTSGYMQEHPEDFAPFVPQGKTVKEFTRTEVEPMDRESEQLQIQALVSELKVPLRIEYIDQSAGPVNGHNFPHDAEPLVVLLYRPGHYDILCREGAATGTATAGTAAAAAAAASSSSEAK
jgi:ubiquitin thioesterase protein OTUB1